MDANIPKRVKIGSGIVGVLCMISFLSYAIVAYIRNDKNIHEIQGITLAILTSLLIGFAGMLICVSVSVLCMAIWKECCPRRVADARYDEYAPLPNV